MSKERMFYLKELSDEYGVDINTVMALADLLGPNEDHDGLIVALEDINGGY